MAGRLGLVVLWVLAGAVGCRALVGLTEFEVVTATGGGTGGGAGACNVPSDCPGEDATCRYRSCEYGRCGMANAAGDVSCPEVEGGVCDGEGACAFDLGHLCTAGTECATGICQDGVCCDEGCAGACESCAGAGGGSPGICAPVPALQDPDGECSAPALGCDGQHGCASCGDTASPIGGTCPGVCDRCDGGDTCVIDCDVDAECSAATSPAIDCPAGWHCEVLCTGADACRDNTIRCPADYACTVTCPDSSHRCEDAVIQCSERGPCSVDCGGGDTCRGTIVECGENECAATCDGGDVPALPECAGSCACTEC